MLLAVATAVALLALATTDRLIRMGVGKSRSGFTLVAMNQHDEYFAVLRLALCGWVLALHEDCRDAMGSDEYPYGVERKWFLCYRMPRDVVH